MSLRTTLALLVLALALGAWVYFVEIEGKRESEAEEAAARKLLVLDPESVTRLELPLEGSGIAQLTRAPAEAAGSDAASWRLEQPIAYPADEPTVAGILSGLERLESKAVIEAPPDDLAPFGLDPAARKEVRIWTGEAEPRVLQLGGTSPLADERYVALPGDEMRVFAVSAGSISSLSPPLERLRDKRILRFSPEAARGLSVSEHGTLLVRVRRVAAAASTEGSAEAPDASPPDPEADWQLAHPAQIRADGGQIERVIQNLSFARASRFIDEPGDLSAYGLDRPELELAFELSGQSEPLRLELGRKETNAYARVNGVGPVFELRARVLSDVPRDVFAWRFKRVLALDDDAVRSLELRFPREARSYRFSRDDRQWTPEDTDVKVESLKVDDVVFALRELDATGIEQRSVDPAELGLDPPRVRVVAFDAAGNELGWLELGDPTADQDIPARSSEGPTLWRVSDELGRDVPLGQEAFQNAWLEQPPPAPQPEASEAAEPPAESPPTSDPS